MAKRAKSSYHRAITRGRAGGGGRDGTGLLPKVHGDPGTNQTYFRRDRNAAAPCHPPPSDLLGNKAHSRTPWGRVSGPERDPVLRKCIACKVLQQPL